jgi:hypothetical protein
MSANTDIRKVSGLGQRHTAKFGRRYLTITLPEIRTLVDTPPSVEKAQAQWLIPSSSMTREFKAQEAYGQFHLLWADLDQNAPPLDRVAAFLDAGVAAMGQYDFASASASLSTTGVGSHRAVFVKACPECGLPHRVSGALELSLSEAAFAFGAAATWLA